MTTRSRTEATGREPDERTGARQAPEIIVLGPGDGRVVPGPEGITLKATAEQTNGSVGFFEATSPPGFGPPRHIHHTSDEMFYILSGHFQFLAGERLIDAPAGTFVFIPRGTVHAPKVVGTEPGRLVTAFVPGGQEGAFEEFARMVAAQGDGSFDMEQAQVIARKYNSEFVGPPL